MERIYTNVHSKAQKPNWGMGNIILFYLYYKYIRHNRWDLGGGVALDHPIRSSGSRIIVTLAQLLQSGEYGLEGVCNGVGGVS